MEAHESRRLARCGSPLRAGAGSGRKEEREGRGVEEEEQEEEPVVLWRSEDMKSINNHGATAPHR